MLKIVSFLFILALPSPLPAQAVPAAATNTASTNAPSATAPAIALGDVVAQAQAAATQLHQDQLGLDPDATQQAIGDKLPQLARQIDDQVAHDAPLLDGGASVTALQKSQSAWEDISASVASAQGDLSDRVNQLNSLLWDLTQLGQTWQATKDAAAKSNAPAETLQRIAQILNFVDATTKLVLRDQKGLYSMQNSVAAQDARARSFAGKVNTALSDARKRLFERDHPPLWSADALAQPAAGIMEQERLSLAAHVIDLKNYVVDKIGQIVANFLLFAVLVMSFFSLRRTIHERAQKEAALRPAARVFDVPLATALLLSLLFAGWLYPDAPPLLEAMIGAVALAPALIIIRRLIEPALFPLLYAVVMAYTVDQVRLVIRPGGVLSRFILIFELIAVAAFLLAALRSKALGADKSQCTRADRMVRAYLHVAFIVFLAAGVANVIGLVQLSLLIARGMLQSSYCAVVFYAGVRILDALAITALNVPPLSGFRVVRRHCELLYRNSAAAIRWVAEAVWVVVALQLFTIRQPLWDEIHALLDTKLPWGAIKDVHIRDVLAFPITVWAAFLLSRFIRFCLEEEVYPNLPLGRGIPYAISTTVHYAILLLGFFIALDALGVDLSKFAVLTAAFGVGLGFGLQNIMNNFMSGIILLFERPVKVGDIIQMDPNTVGTVDRIGIRASVVRLTNGSELIIPNGNLISNPVTNWTLSSCERLIEIPVNVASKIDPPHVLNLLTQLAHANSGVLKNPSPEALLVSFGAAGLSFRLRAWVDAEQDWLKITSDLSLAINAALGKENITLG